MNTNVIDISINPNESNGYRQSVYLAPPSILAESEKDAAWYFRNLQYWLGFYNLPIGSYQVGFATGDGTQGVLACKTH